MPYEQHSGVEEVPLGAKTSKDKETPTTDPLDDAPGNLERMEKLLAEISASLDSNAREQAHREFSLSRLTGAILQVLVVGLLLAAAVELLLAGALAGVLIKLAFAGVLQLSALTAFVVARPKD